ncbi:MAG: CZB domain-containing protein [Chloroherpetonaceae bacterium]|nr:CZB domain-containing protein [Chloroherpetonaceae bacterium]
MAISFKQWVTKLVQKASAAEAQLSPEQEEVAPEAVDPVEAEAAGLNFHTAIISHQNWKARFKAMIESGMAEALNPDVIAQDNQCAVGKWIYGVAKEKYGDHPLWEKLRADHAFFHSCASRVLAMIIRGDKQKALLEIARMVHMHGRLTMW